jgi:hypothetical protein
MKVKVSSAVMILALTTFSACSNEVLRSTGPSLSNPRLDLGIEGTPAKVCVSDDSPAGNYTFNVTNIDYASDGSTVPGPNPAIVARGACFDLVTRLVPADESNPSADPVTTITYSYAGNDALGGAGYLATQCVDDPGIPASSPCGTTVVGHVNFVAGTVATFSFISGARMIESLRVMLSDLELKKPTNHKLNDILDNALKGLGKGKKNSHACDELDRTATGVEDFGNRVDSFAHRPRLMSMTKR